MQFWPGPLETLAPLPRPPFTRPPLFLSFLSAAAVAQTFLSRVPSLRSPPANLRFPCRPPLHPYCRPSSLLSAGAAHSYRPAAAPSSLLPRAAHPCWPAAVRLITGEGAHDASLLLPQHRRRGRREEDASTPAASLLLLVGDLDSGSPGRPCSLLRWVRKIFPSAPLLFFPYVLLGWY